MGTKKKKKLSQVIGRDKANSLAHVWQLFEVLKLRPPTKKKTTTTTKQKPKPKNPKKPKKTKTKKRQQQNKQQKPNKHTCVSGLNDVLCGSNKITLDISSAAHTMTMPLSRVCGMRGVQPWKLRGAAVCQVYDRKPQVKVSTNRFTYFFLPVAAKEVFALLTASGQACRQATSQPDSQIDKQLQEVRQTVSIAPFSNGLIFRIVLIHIFFSNSCSFMDSNFMGYFCSLNAANSRILFCQWFAILIKTGYLKLLISFIWLIP